ncbi:cytochrome P460 family protein [Bradyrhizobium sp. AS23.2]|uniref:cytochrome P460 family protein n=1 Tax=Bradyrhizobium sp. AS23.2 TaxID=1680155 RepID=UPI0032DF62D9
MPQARSLSRRRRSREGSVQNDNWWKRKQCRRSRRWCVIVKDNVGRFSGNKLWGEGWGWSWFDGANPQKTASTGYTTDCQSCRVPARQSDWICTGGYPLLIG